MKRKLTYQSKPVKKILIPISGQVYLQYENDEEISFAKRGDLMLHPRCDALHTTRQGDYFSTGVSGYFKVDVHDGKQWCAVLIQDIFPGREHHFSKMECPIDTYELCAGMLKAMAGKNLMRTYREHYAPEDADETAEEKSND
jgi:hypothetical protein